MRMLLKARNCSVICRDTASCVRSGNRFSQSEGTKRIHKVFGHGTPCPYSLLQKKGPLTEMSAALLNMMKGLFRINNDDNGERSTGSVGNSAGGDADFVVIAGNGLGGVL